MQKLEIKGTGEIKEAVRGEKYRIRFKYKDPNDGSWRYAPQKTINGNKAKARRELEMYKSQFEIEFNAPNSSMTLGEYARQWHDDRRTMGNLSELTLDRDEIEISQIEEQFSNVVITDVTPMLIKASLLNLKKSGKSESAIFKYWAKLSQVLKSATREDLISVNPCDKLDGIKRPRSKDRKSLTLEQAISLAKTIRESPMEGRLVVIWLALALGLRRGEALGLQWKYVNLEDGTISIVQQYTKNHNLGDPKCSSKRTLYIDEGTVAFLRKWKYIMTLMFPNADIEVMPVCCSQSGDFLDPTAFDKWRRAFFVANGLARYTKSEEWYDKRGIKRYRHSGYEGYCLHELRHTQATLLIGMGEDLRTVQEIMGHKSMQMTMTYTHPIEENKRRASTTFSKAVLTA